MSTGNILIQISTDHLYPHPDNPRKDVGDVTELAESIKKNGIMQNLTVIPKDEDCKSPSMETLDTDYMVLIGHRRLAAAKMAGITELPCKVVFDMSHNEQITTMLEENMQRSDLTIPEQAESFQMLLDLGETAQTIAEKTGFSQTTVYHRLNIAKLDKNAVKKMFEHCEDEKSYQFTIADFAALEKVKSIDKRNAILAEVDDGEGLRYEAEKAADEEKQEEWITGFMDILIEADIKAAPKIYEKQRYSGKWSTVTSFKFGEEYPTAEALDFPEEVFWAKSYRGVDIVKKEDEKEKEKSPWEIKHEKEQENRKKLETLFKKMGKDRLSLAVKIYTGKLTAEDDDAVLKDAWDSFKENDAYALNRIYCEILGEKNFYSISKEKKSQVDKDATSNIAYQIAAADIAGELSAVSWDGKYDSEKGERLTRIYAIAQKFGLKLTDEEIDALEGTSDLYLKDDKRE